MTHKNESTNSLAIAARVEILLRRKEVQVFFEFGAACLDTLDSDNELNTDVLYQENGFLVRAQKTNNDSGPHSIVAAIDNKQVLFYGYLFENTGPLNFAEYVYRQKSCFNRPPHQVDGEFIYAEVGIHDRNYEVWSERFGTIPLYYVLHEKDILFATTMYALRPQRPVDDIDPSALSDILRYGTLVGDKTLFSSMKLLPGGFKLVFKGSAVHKEEITRFCFQPDYSASHEELLDDIASSYRTAVEKRLNQHGEQAAVLLSGGMDSRFLLATLNSCSNEPVYCYSFGQPGSEEVGIARQVAALGDNPFIYCVLTPSDFLTNASLYQHFVGIEDSFPQSYILKALDSIDTRSLVMTGYSLDAILGGTFLDSEAVIWDGDLLSLVKSRDKLPKMNLFAQPDLVAMSKDGAFADSNDGEIFRLLDAYSDIPARDSIQPFAIAQRAVRCVLNRESIPRCFREFAYPSTDMHFLESVSRLPAQERLGHSFYRDLFMHLFPEYCSIPYNNTTLPISAPLSLWHEGTDIEGRRERLYERAQRETSSHSPHTYYPHYYSDFTGYSRYDATWLRFFEEALFSDETILTDRYINADFISQLYEEHNTGKTDSRKKLVTLASLETALRQAFA